CHGTPLPHIVRAAGVSHGAFYRYFKNKDDLAQVVAVRAMRRVQSTMTEIPFLDDENRPGSRNGALRAWLRRYCAAHAAETAAIRVWADAAQHHPALQGDSAAALDWGRRRMALFLEQRGFGDVDAEAFVGIALLSAFGRQE